MICVGTASNLWVCRPSCASKYGDAPFPLDFS